MHDKPPFNCIDAATLVCESRDRTLSVAELSNIQHHVANCIPCQAAKQQLEALFEHLDHYFEQQ